MISSISQRSLPKTCGLFDTGLAGDQPQITSIASNAPADVLSEFDLGGHDPSITFIDPTHLSLYDNVVGPFINKDPQLQSNSTVDEETDNWDLLDDLSEDHLGDESLDAFINLDKYLIGNSFFDEDGNLEQEPAEVNPVIDIPTIEDFDQSFVDALLDSPEIIQNTGEMVQCTPVEVATLAVTAGKPSRKRKKTTKVSAVKTSLFEIPESSNATDDNQLDHDYSSKSKRQKLTTLAFNLKPDSDAYPSPSSDGCTNAASVTVSESNNICDTIFSSDPLPSTSQLDKQTVRRLKNNVASKRSREQRKKKYSEMDVEADELIVRNDELRKEIVELEKLTKQMKEALIAKMVGK